jgi:hypothetical protein
MGQNELIQHEVFLLDKINNLKREKLETMKALFFLLPTESNFNILQNELRNNPLYMEYYICLMFL